MKLLLSVMVIGITVDVYAQVVDREHQGPQTCGGRLKGPVGIIQTPYFPNPFPVPIKCKWIIEHDIVNGTISIYFTQQYTTSGLTFTEYTYYDESYKLEERRALTVTEENITKIKWLQWYSTRVLELCLSGTAVDVFRLKEGRKKDSFLTAGLCPAVDLFRLKEEVQSPVLVVELNLNRLEGTQLRALGLLSVFGFNITYSVRGPAKSPGPSSCSAIECRLLGHCYARENFQQFYCSCFDGYSGVDCGMGPLCPRTSNMCKNGGTCRQMGPAAVSCICAPGYTGDLCEAQIAQQECGLEECSEVCKEGTSCDCSPKDADFTSARFESRLQVVDQPNVNISREIVKELTSYLIASNITLDDDIEVLNISAVEASGARTAHIRVWSPRRSAGALRVALARLAATRTRTATLRLLPDILQFDMQPALSLHALVVNQRPEVWEGSEFILTCMAYGSPDITFTWYKDGVKINFNATNREIWSRLVSEDALGRRMSVLGVSVAQQIDGGTWSCAADDASRRRCRALTLTVLTTPTIRLVPSTLTVMKGDNVSITCLAGAGRAHGVLGFSWARERSLLPMQPDRHVWEDLYPAGSVLRIYNVQKSTQYRCQVSSVAGTNSAGVTVWALSVDDAACQSDETRGTRWSKTAPGAHASAACPPGYNGEIVRFCEPKTEQHGVKWILPDYSGCVAESLKNVYEQFNLVSHGYSWGNVSDICRQYLSILRVLPMHPGSGVTPLRHTTQILKYLLSGAVKYADRQHSVTHLLNIYDHLLTQPDAFLDEQKIYDLQNAIVNTAGMKNMIPLRWQSFSTISVTVARGMSAHFELRYASIDEWLLTSGGVEPSTNDRLNSTIVIVLYHDLKAKLPSLKRSIELQAGREMQYVVCSQQVQVFITGPPFAHTLQHTVTLVFDHSRNYSADGTKLACGLRSVEEPGAWSISACDVRISGLSRTTCRCHGTGTIALLSRATHKSTDTEKELRGVAVISVSVAGAMCMCTCALQIISLVPGIKRGQDSLTKLLKAATAVGHAAAMFTLLHCDTRDTACPGMLGWLLAACWCVSCAALCAQPLLLHTEMAGRGQRKHSVGLLAGVCLLTCLCARLWGDTPLQAHSAAGAVYFGGVALLTALALALALCARKTLVHVTHKLPPDRKFYIRDRNHVVCNTLVLLLTMSAVQIAGVTYLQPGGQQYSHVAALSVAAIVNGIAMLICFVIRDEECLRATRCVLSPTGNRNWDNTRAGDISLSLYIKQAGEVESRGGAVDTIESCSSPVSPAVSYWRAHSLDSPARMHRRQSNPDSRADIVRCVEYKESIVSGRGCTQAPVCDLIPAGTASQYRACATVCAERHEPVPISISPPVVSTYNGCFQPYTEKTVDTAMETCTICAKSNPDVSKLSSYPIKSCLKKNSRGFTSSTSLPSIDIIRDDKSRIEHVNREWSKAYDNPQAEKVLHKISHDLDFLLNRTQSNSPKHIEEAPT